MFFGNQRAYDIAEGIVTFAAGASIPLTNAVKMGKVVTTVDKAKFIGIELSKEVVGTAGGFGGVWLGEKLGLSQDQSMFIGMIASIASSKGADWVDNNFDNLVLAGKYTFNNSGKNVTLLMNGAGTFSEFCDIFTDIKNGKIVFNSIDDVINLGINSVDDLMKLGVNSVDDLAKLKVSSIDDLANIGIDGSNLKKIGIDPKVFEEGSNPRKIPGVATGGENLSNSIKSMRGSNGNIGLVPKEVADNLRGRKFNSFDDFRNAFRQEYSTSSYAGEFSKANIERMRKGLASKAQSS